MAAGNRPIDQYGGTVGGVSLVGVDAGVSVPIKGSAAAIYTKASAAVTTTGNSGDIAATDANEVIVDINVTAVTGTTPQVIFRLERKGSDGIYYTIWTSAAVTAPGQVSQTFGPGCETPKPTGPTVRLAWDITGTTPSITFSASVQRD